MEILKNLEPQKVFYYFEELSKIPHGSGNTKAISDYCVSFAKERGLWVYQDELDNVVIKKSAYSGYENAPVTVLQGHIDMVCIADDGYEIDFKKEPIKLMTDGEWVWAKKTTLGGDDGIAVAMALAILDSDDIPHPALEVILTSDEEVGMEGAIGLDASVVSGRRVINIDSEAEGVITVSCAGGIRISGAIPLTKEKCGLKGFNITAGGLLGGHSGVEINEGRINANKALAMLLLEISKRGELLVSDFGGGVRDNAIPANAFAKIYADESCVNDSIALVLQKLGTEYKETDPDLKISCEPCEICSVFKETDRILKTLNESPDGVISMSKSIDGLVQTSLNMGIVRTNDNGFEVCFMIRSSVNEEKAVLGDKVVKIIEENGGMATLSGEYSAWEYRENSPLRKLAGEVFLDMYGREPVYEAIHAGLECGILGGKLDNMDAISIGPDLLDIHTPKERMNVKSVERVYKYVLEILKRSSF